MKFKPQGLATGIGSLPYTATDTAVEIIKKYLPDIPHWPQLPRRGGDEGFVHQFLDSLVRLQLLEKRQDKVVFPVRHRDWPDRLTEFYGLYLAAEAGDDTALEQFAFPAASASGYYAFVENLMQTGTGSATYLKGHLAGPLTIGFQLKDENGKLAYYEDQLRDLLVKTLALHARWQAKHLGQLGLPVIIFVDEPGIRVYGSSSYITVTREMVLEDLNSVFAAIHTQGGLAGVHSCDAIDWSLLYESDLQIVNLDAYQYGESLIPYTRELKSFLERGGVIAWGIVPTLDEAFGASADSLLERLEQVWQQLVQRGIPRQQLIQQCLITPACGTGLLEPALAERIYLLTRQLAEKVQALK